MSDTIIKVPTLRKENVVIKSGHKIRCVADTRLGKTYTGASMAAPLAEQNVIPLLSVFNSLGSVDDMRQKLLAQGWDDDNIIYLNKDKAVTTFLSQLSGGYKNDNFVYVMNSDYRHYERILKYVRRDPEHFKQQLLFQFEDEAHYGRDKKGSIISYESWETEIVEEWARRRENVNELYNILKPSQFMTSATLEKDWLGGELNILKKFPGYVEPTAAINEHISSAECKLLRERGEIPWRIRDALDNRINNFDQELVLFNGIFRTTSHENLIEYLKLSTQFKLNKDVVFLLIHKSEIVEYSPGRNIRKTVHDPYTKSKVRDAQTAIDIAYHRDNYRYIYCIGHKMAELGQTFADHHKAISLSVQIMAFSSDEAGDDYVKTGIKTKKKGYVPKYSSAAQWNRTGGYTVLPDNKQVIICPKIVWDDYVEYHNWWFREVERAFEGETEFTLPRPSVLKNDMPEQSSNVTVQEGFIDKENEPEKVTQWHKKEALEQQFGLPFPDIETIDKENNPFVREFKKVFKSLNIHSKTWEAYSHTDEAHGNFQLCKNGIREVTKRVSKETPHKFHDVHGKIKYRKSNPDCNKITLKHTVSGIKS